MLSVGFAAVLALVNLTVTIVPVVNSHFEASDRDGIIVAAFAAVPAEVCDKAYVPASFVSALSTLDTTESKPDEYKVPSLATPNLLPIAKRKSL